MTLQNFKDQLNTWGRDNIPFFFCVDFELEKPLAFTLDQVYVKDILFATRAFTNDPHLPRPHEMTGLRGFKKKTNLIF